MGTVEQRREKGFYSMDSSLTRAFQSTQITSRFFFYSEMPCILPQRQIELMWIQAERRVKVVHLGEGVKRCRCANSSSLYGEINGTSEFYCHKT